MADQEPLVRSEPLEQFLADRLGAAPIRIERHRAGHSNETFFVDYGRRRYVLRRPPRGAFLPSAHDVTREYRILAALQETPVRVPRTILLCDDESVIGAPFYLMERVEGCVIRDGLPRNLTAPEDRKAIGSEIVDALAELHTLDHGSLPLEGFGHPSAYLERQLKRWRGQMELTLPFTRPVPDLERVGGWLEANLPKSPPATLVHGDYKLDNVMFAPDAPARLVSILDWEMSTIGDPVADLGWLLSFWREPDDLDEPDIAGAPSVTVLPGFARRAELVARYQDRTGTDVRALDWYVVLAVWKLAILLEGSYARHLAGMTDDPFFAAMEGVVPALARRAGELAV
ncbi:MAG TPA: phosphotransferase family protein [Actinomycetota bacterium]|nr:phosphotransferase family protein [Actinomycetota bacterium]